MKKLADKGEDMDSREPWIILGDYIDTWGDATKVGLPMADLKVHTSVLGTTGSGKVRRMAA